MKTTELTSIDTAMDQQLRILNQLKDLVKESQAKNLLDNVTGVELTQLNDYIADMVMASTTAKKLSRNIQDSLDKEEKAKKVTEEKAKKAAAEKKAKEEAAAKAAESEDDDDDSLDFLD